MNNHYRLFSIPLLLVMLGFSLNSHAKGLIDGVSMTYGQDNDSNDVALYRLGLQSRWARSWFKNGAWYLGGYWDAELAYLESDLKNSANDNLIDVGLTPVFRFQRDANLSSGVTPYVEAGIGPHLFSKTRLGQRNYSTAVQFGTLIGFGLGFGNKGQYEIAYRFQHISNGSIKRPNNGINLHLLRLGYSFY